MDRYGSFFGFRHSDYNPAERIRESLCGAIFGIFVFIGSIVLLGWNEKRSVWTAQTIGLARDDMNQLDYGACTPNPIYNNKLVALEGCKVTPSDNATYNNMLRGVISTGIVNGSYDQVFSWKRSASQYVMHEKKSSGSSSRHDDDYYYSKTWVTSSEKWLNPHAQQDCNGDWHSYICNSPQAWYANMNDNEVSSYACFGSSNCTRGNFKNKFVLDKAVSSWSRGVISKFGNSVHANLMPGFWPTNGSTTIGLTAYNCGNYLRTVTPGIPVLCGSSMSDNDLPNSRNQNWGTFKWEWSVRSKSTGTASGLAVQYVDPNGRYNFKEWQNPHHSSCSYCTIGSFYNENMTGQEILDRLESDNNSMTWALRFVGWFVMWLGLHLMVSPIAVAPQIIPCVGEVIGDIVGAILCAVTCVIATSLSLLVIGIAWLAYRPSIGVPLVATFCVGVGAASFIIHRHKKSRQGYGDVHNGIQCPPSVNEYSHITQQPAQPYAQPPGQYPPPQQYPPVDQYPPAQYPAAQYPQAGAYPPPGQPTEM